ncbi:MAG: DUF2905 domain-containing protein [Clostridia bacterium]|nr:DUF2905 domain-containing protein [Clostridia bacterium]
MPPLWDSMAKSIVAIGIGLIALGLIMWALARLGIPGKLPGDILVRKGNFTIYFPIVSCLLLSLILTLLFNVFFRR